MQLKSITGKINYLPLILAVIAILVLITLRERPIKIVEGFPNLPAYPDAVITASAVIDDPTVKDIKKRYVTSWDSKQTVPVLSLWVRDRFPQEGWVLTIPPADPNMDIQEITFEKGKTTLIVSLIRQGAKTEITINYRPGEVVEDGEEEE